MVLTIGSVAPIVALIAGILILLVPRILNYVVAIYLIIIGLSGPVRKSSSLALRDCAPLRAQSSALRRPSRNRRGKLGTLWLGVKRHAGLAAHIT